MDEPAYHDGRCGVGKDPTDGRAPFALDVFPRPVREDVASHVNVARTRKSQRFRDAADPAAHLGDRLAAVVELGDGSDDERVVTRSGRDHDPESGRYRVTRL